MTATSTPATSAEQPAPPPPAPTPPPAPAVAPATSAPQPGQYYYGLGRRKCAIAQVRLFPSGDGQIIVNGRPSREYFGREALDIVLRQPLSAVEGGAYNAVVKVIGGGLSGQAGAVRLGIARALLVADAQNRAALRARGLLTRDARVKERKKPGLKRARKRPQYTKR
jgi:small subunit ribosomal protein S9